MRLRTKEEQKAYLDGYEMCAQCIEKYLTSEGKQKLECLLVAVRNAVEMEDIKPQEKSRAMKGKNVFQILDDMIAHNGQDYPIYANEVIALVAARDALKRQDARLEKVEDIAKEMCDHYCKYPDTWDEEAEGMDLSESEHCAKCPLNRL